MAKHGKKYLEAAKKVDHSRAYAPEEAMSLVKEVSYAKFDASVDVHLRMGVDPRHADQQVRGVVVLPNGTGKQVRIVVFAEGEGARIAQEAGADHVGSDDLIKRIQDGWTDFEVAIATPQMMGKVGRLGKVLGPRGLMPSPKAGTIVQPDDLPRLIRESRGGRVEFKVDKTANIHVGIGKINFTASQLEENFTALMDAINRAKPTGAKGTYIRSVTVASTMSPGIGINTATASGVKVA